MKEKVTFGDIYTVIFQEEDSNKECIIVYNDEKGLCTIKTISNVD